MADIDELRERLLRIWGLFWDSGVRVIWLCAYSTAAALVFTVLFLFNDQGADLLRISAERGPGTWNIAFVVGVACLGTVVWYCARLLMGREFVTFRFDPVRTRWARRWLPRLLGFSVPLAVGIGFLRFDTDSRSAAVTLGVIFLVLALALLAFFVKRRKLFMAGSAQMLETTVAELPASSRRIMTIVVVVSFLLTAAFILWPVALPRLLGAPAIVALGLAGITAFGSMVLTFFFLANGQPAGTALALALAVLFGLINDNHGVRLAAAEAPVARPTPAERLGRWRTAWREQAAATADQRRVVIVSAAGGGIRAAYWTASTLAAMETVPGFSERLFAISGVSGGSVGAATYVATKRAQAEGAAPADTLAEVRRILGEDSLSPVLAGLLFSDLVQRFLPLPLAAADRQRFLERSFEEAMGPSTNPFAQSFQALYRGPIGERLPSLLLNATVVESGGRAVVSNMDVRGFPDVADLIADGAQTHRIKLSAAAGMSARFTYVSPAGRLERASGERMRVVDGGYFENSGAATALDLLSVLDAGAGAYTPVLVLIRNDPASAYVCNRVGADGPAQREGPAGSGSADFLSELASPLRALLNARSARGKLAEVGAVNAVQRRGGAVVEISLAAVNVAASAEQRQRLRRRLVEPPLGWSLSRDAKQTMSSVLDDRSGGLDREFQILERALSGRLLPEDACSPR